MRLIVCWSLRHECLQSRPALLCAGQAGVFPRHDSYRAKVGIRMNFCLRLTWPVSQECSYAFIYLFYYVWRWLIQMQICITSQGCYFDLKCSLTFHSAVQCLLCFGVQSTDPIPSHPVPWIIWSHLCLAHACSLLTAELLLGQTVIRQINQTDAIAAW